MSDLVSRQEAIKQFCNQCKGRNEPCEHRRSCETMKVLKSLPSAEPKTDGVFVKGGLTISGEPPMPEGCMDCKLQNRCLCIPPDLSADEISELYISRRPNCPLSMIAEPKTGEWVRRIVGTDYWHCSECGDYGLHTDFCTNCGADMRGEEE